MGIWMYLLGNLCSADNSSHICSRNALLQWKLRFHIAGRCSTSLINCSTFRTMVDFFGAINGNGFSLSNVNVIDFCQRFRRIVFDCLYRTVFFLCELNRIFWFQISVKNTITCSSKSYSTVMLSVLNWSNWAKANTTKCSFPTLMAVKMARVECEVMVCNVCVRRRLFNAIAIGGDFVCFVFLLRVHKPPPALAFPGEGFKKINATFAQNGR